MRIGQLLLQRGWVEHDVLAAALEEHGASGVRIVSYLVSRGSLDFDDGARALAEQTGVAPALRRHIERRDKQVLGLIDAEIARRACALPLFRNKRGALIVCVRDPADAALADLARTVEGDLVFAIAPAGYLERLVEKAYEIPLDLAAEAELADDLDDEVEDIEDDLDEQPELIEAVPPPPPPQELDFELPIEEDTPDPDFSIDIDLPLEPAKPKSRPLPIEIKIAPVPAAAPDPLDATIAACRDIDEVGWLFDVIMAFVGKRWRSSLLLEARGDRAHGIRGHGPGLGSVTVKTYSTALANAVAIPPDARELLAGSEPGSVALMRGDAIAYVLLVGDGIDRDPDDTSVDLALLGEAAGEALARM